MGPEAAESKHVSPLRAVSQVLPNSLMGLVNTSPKKPLVYKVKCLGELFFQVQVLTVGVPMWASKPSNLFSSQGEAPDFEFSPKYGVTVLRGQGIEFLVKLCPRPFLPTQCAFLFDIQYVVITQPAFRFLLEEIVHMRSNN